MALRTLFWPPEAVTHVAETADLEQPWLEVHPLTLLCRCPCKECATLTTSDACTPYQGYCTMYCRSSSRWQLMPTTRMGACPNSGRALIFSDVCAMGFCNTYSVVAVLVADAAGGAQWHFHAWDCSAADDPLFFDPTRVEVFMSVFLVVGPTQARCVDLLERLFRETKQETGFRRSDVRFQLPTAELRPLEDTVRSLKTMARWCEENVELLRATDAAGSGKSPRREPSSKPAAKPAAATAKRGRPAVQPANGEGDGEGSKRSKKEATPQRPAAKSPAATRSPSGAGSGSDESGEESESSLPVGWARAFDDEGTEYFFHVTTLKSQWERPE